MPFKETEIESDRKNETKNFIGIFDFVESHNRNKKGNGFNVENAV